MSLHDYALVCATKRLFRHGAVCGGPGPLKCVTCAGEQFGRAVGTATAARLPITGPLLRRAADMVIPISTAVRDGCGLAESPAVRVIPNFASPLPGPPEATAGAALLAALPREPFILFFGDASVDKGAAHLAAVHRSLDGPPPLVFAGRCMIEGLRTQPGVVVAGPLPHAHVIEAVRRSLFTAAPSLWAEPFGLVALESAAAGRPVVASDTSGFRDIVVHGETRLLVPPGMPPRSHRR
jgi:glycogen(starch) synthase